MPSKGRGGRPDGSAGARGIESWGLTLTLSALFLVCLVGQAISGWESYNQTQAVYHAPPVNLSDFVRTGTFLNAIFSNLQAALLQLAALIIFTTFLHQRGASHSRPPGRRGPKPADESGPDRSRRAPRSARVIYEHSLFLAFFAGFVICLALHAYFGAQQYNLQLAQEGQPQVTVGAFLVSASFWFSTFQVWQVEFLAIALLTILSVYLREKGSAESKPVNESDESTGVIEG
jgi:hypothetical protein